MSLLDELLIELEETLRTEETLPLYDFSWTLRGMKKGLSEVEIQHVCQHAYDEITRRHALHLEWFEWSDTDLPAGTPAEPGAALDFDINSTGTIPSPFLTLVPD